MLCPVTSVAPTHYATNLKALTLAECCRFSSGLFSGALTWLFTRWQKPQGKSLLPISYDEMEAGPEEVSSHFRSRLGEIIPQFHDLGFGVLAYQRIKHSEDASFIDAVSVIFRSTDGRWIGHCSVLLNRDPAQAGGLRRTEVFSFTAFDVRGHSRSVHNLGRSLDQRPGNRSRHRASTNLAELYQSAREDYAGGKEPLRAFAGWAEVRQALEEDDLQNFLYRRDVRKLFVPLAT